MTQSFDLSDDDPSDDGQFPAGECYYDEVNTPHFSWTTWIGHPDHDVEYGFDRKRSSVDASTPPTAALLVPTDDVPEWVIEAAEAFGYDVMDEPSDVSKHTHLTRDAKGDP